MSPWRAFYELPSAPGHGRTPAFTGMALFVIIEATALLSVITSYFYLGVLTGPWPPRTVPPPELGLPGAGVLALVLSAAGATYVDRRLIERPRSLRLLLPLGLLLVCGYLAASVVTLAEREYRWDDHAYGSVSWLSDGMSLLHVGALLGIGGFVLWTSWRDPAAHRPEVRVLALYWAFAAFTGLATWLTLYLFPVVAGGIG